MRFQYSTNDPSQDEFDSLPRIPLILHHNNQRLEVIGLVDSGATVNLLPYQIGIQLGLVWDDSKAIIRLAGNIGNQPAMPVFLMAEIGEFAPVRLVFAWVKSDNVSLILGQTNFFLEFDVHFYPTFRRYLSCVNRG
ncbi:hypothetical protein [Kamptonema formosum]|nr:hypothetical protein [Kamptonema formosum]